MRTIGAALLALALALPAAAQIEAKKCPKDCDCQAKPAKNFGVDWEKIGPGRDRDLTAIKIDTFLDRWLDLPDRLTAAVWNGAAAGGTFGVLIVGALFFVVHTRSSKT